MADSSQDSSKGPGLSGVGLALRQLTSGGFIVAKVLNGGPSDHKGVKPGDRLELVDRTEVGVVRDARCRVCERSNVHMRSNASRTLR